MDRHVSLPSLQGPPARPAAGGGLLIELPVAGLRCASCVAHLEKALGAVPGVVEVSVNLATARATVRASVATTPATSTLTAAVAAAGYTVPLASTSLRLTGLHCAGCVGTVESALSRVPGVLAATVNLASGEARAEHVAGVTRAALEGAVRAAGYGVAPSPGRTRTRPSWRSACQHEEAATLRRRLVVAVVASIVVMALSAVLMVREPASGPHAIGVLHLLGAPMHALGSLLSPLWPWSGRARCAGCWPPVSVPAWLWAGWPYLAGARRARPAAAPPT